jgi:hypothetical protein
MPAILALGTQQGVYVLTEGDGEWKLLGRGLSNRAIHCLASNSQGILAGTPAGLFRSSNLEEWQPLINEVGALGIHSLAVHPQQPSVLLCGTSPAGLWLSVDHGQSFQELAALKRHPGSSHWTFPEAPYRSRLVRLFLHPTDAEVICAGVHTGGFYLSGDVGQSWHERTAVIGRQIHDLCQHPLLPGRLYGCTPVGFFLSENLGEAWESRNQGLAYLYSTCLAVHPEEPNVVFLASHRNAQGGGAIYRSSSAGTRWEACSGLPFKPDMRYTAMVTNDHLLVVGTSAGEVFCSRDLGGTWSKVRSNLPPIQSLHLISA